MQHALRTKTVQLREGDDSRKTMHIHKVHMFL